MKRILIAFLLLAILLTGLAACGELGITITPDAPTTITLTPPRNLRIENGALVWNPVDHSTNYKVSIDGNEDLSETNSYTLPDLSDGEHVFRVRAMGDGTDYSTSVWSAELSITFNSSHEIRATAITNIKVNGKEKNENGEYYVAPGSTNDITFTVEPQDTTDEISVRFAAQPSIASLNGRTLTIDNTATPNTLLNVIISAGDAQTQITLHVIQLYNVYLRLNGGEMPSSFDTSTLRDIPQGNTVYAPAAPTRSGYIFQGWYTDPELKNPYTPVQITDNFTLYAKWNQVKVTFISDGITIDSREVPSGTKAASVRPQQDPEKEGYTFGGWYVDERYSSYFDFSGSLTQDITLYAGWTLKEYTVRFDTKGGDSIDSIKVSINTDYKLDSVPTPTRQYYSFMGWYTNDALSVAFDLTAELKNEDGTTLYAAWEAKQMKVRFADYDDKGSVSDEQKNTITDKTTDATRSFKVPALATPVKTGFTFADWYDEITEKHYTDLEDVPFFPATDAAEAYDRVIYATWTRNSYTLTFTGDTGAGIETVKSTSVLYESAIELPVAPVRKGYDFLGWKNGTENSPETMPANDLTLTAEYSIHISSVIYIVNGDKVKDDQYAYGSVITYKEISDIYSAEELDARGPFSGWTVSIDPRPETMPDSDITLTGTFEQMKHSVTFIVEEDTSFNQTKTAYYKGKIPDYTPVKEDYTFRGWTYKDGTIPTMMPNEDITLYGSFAPIEYTVTLDKNGGVANGSISVVYKNSLPAFSAIERVGYTLTGYYTATEGGTAVITKDGTLIADVEGYSDETGHWNKRGGAVLYAQWVANPYTVVYDGNKPAAATENVTNVPNTDTWTYDNKEGAPLASEPSLVGWSFDGWYSEPTCENKVGNAGDTLFKANLTTGDMVTLYAHWIPNTYNVKYDGNKPSKASGNVANMPSDSSFTYDATNKLANMPTLTGWHFEGWYRESTCENKVGGASATLEKPNLSTGDAVTLYASWTANVYTVEYDLNGGTKGSIAPTSMTYDEVSAVSAPTKTGYVFAGWTVTSGLHLNAAKWGTTSDPTTAFSSTSTICQNGSDGIVYFKNLNTTDYFVTLTANWTPPYNVQYDLNGGTKGSSAPTTMTYDTSAAVSAPTKTGYKFSGWTVTSGLDPATAKWGTTSSPSISISSSSTVCKNGETGNVYFRNLNANGKQVTLTASWTPNTYTLNFDNSQGGLLNNVYTSESRAQTLSVVYDGSKREYSLTANSTTDSYCTIGQDVYLSSGVTYHMHVKPTFDTPNGRLQVFYGINASYSEAQSMVFSTEETKSFTVKQTGLYAIRFDTDYCKSSTIKEFWISDVPSSKTVRYKESTGISSSVLSTYKPDGYFSGDTLNVIPDTTFYKSTTATVTLNQNGGSGGTTGIYISYFQNGYSTVSITPPTRSGYIFVGYYANSSSVGSGNLYWTPGQTKIAVRNNITLYAHWVKSMQDYVVYASGKDKAYSSTDNGNSDVKWKSNDGVSAIKEPAYTPNYSAAEIKELKAAGYNYITITVDTDVLVKKPAVEWIAVRMYNGSFIGDINIFRIDVDAVTQTTNVWVEDVIVTSSCDISYFATSGNKIQIGYGVSGGNTNEWWRGYTILTFTPSKTKVGANAGKYGYVYS